MKYETPSPDDLDEVFTALANRHRREVVLLLAVRPATIGQLAQRVGLTLPAIHRHIKILESAHLVRRTKVGRVNLLALQRTALRRLQDWTDQFAPGGAPTPRRSTTRRPPTGTRRWPRPARTR